MKYIVIGLGNFGGLLSVRLTEMGHEVVGADSAKERVEALRDKLSTTICLDAGNPEALNALPLAQVDIVIVAIGESFAASVQAVAGLRQAGVKRIIARGLNQLHIGVLQTLGVERVIFPEKDGAEIFAQSLSLSGFVSSYRLDAQYYIFQFSVPKELVGRTIEALSLEKDHSLRLITIKRIRQTKSLLGLSHSERVVNDDYTPDSLIEDGDTLIIYGTLKAFDDFTRWLRKRS